MATMVSLIYEKTILNNAYVTSDSLLFWPILPSSHGKSEQLMSELWVSTERMSFWV